MKNSGKSKSTKTGLIFRIKVWFICENEIQILLIKWVFDRIMIIPSTTIYFYYYISYDKWGSKFQSRITIGHLIKCLN